MSPRDFRPRLQFSLRALLILMLTVASFFAGRMSLQRQLDHARAVEAEARRAHEAAMQAEKEARYLAELTRAQLQFAEAMREPQEPSPANASDTSN